MAKNKNKPLIGVNLDITVEEVNRATVQATYYDAVLAGGGVPVLVPPMPTPELRILLGQLNGIVMIGGRDYAPELYGEAALPEVKLVSAPRQEFDLRLLDVVLRETNLPVLAICGGCQALNIALGGSLVQHIPHSFPDSTVVHGPRTKHIVNVVKGSKLARYYNPLRVDVPTSHHQSVKQLGKGLCAVAFADDGVIEAVEHRTRPFTIGVQWHPERDIEGSVKLLRGLVRAARRTMKL